MTATPGTIRTLIDELLEEQQRLTAVERFANRHEHGELPVHERYYRALLPIEKPRAGEQYAFAVDLDACTGCKACVSACHSLNGLDEDEIWRNVGVLHGGTSAQPYQQTITTACHHCVEPACLEGCPVRAYEKCEETGIVRHLDDQCIGCQYCVLKCPYDVPKYSAKKGIVRKCDMCSNRLADGEAPACVQACPTGAISIRVVSKSAATHAARGTQLVPGAFDSGYTKPTTSYLTQRPMPANARSGDAAALRREHAHWPLIWMLLLTQMAAGLLIGAAMLAWTAPAVFAAAQTALALGGFGLLQLGLAVSVLHLGRPLGAWRAFLGLRTSWMSREIVAFSAFAAGAAAFAGATCWPIARQRFPLLERFTLGLDPSAWSTAIAGVAVVLGVASVACSAMIYVDTRRAFWSAPLVFGKFFATTLVLGATGVAATLGCLGFGESARAAVLVALALHAASFAWEFSGFRRSLAEPASATHRPAQIMWKLGRPLVLVRGVLFTFALGCGLLALGANGTAAAVAASISFAAMTLSQLIERYFFFTAVVAPRMPGGIAA